MPSPARIAATRPGIVSTASSAATCRRSAAARSPTNGATAVATAVHSARTSSSKGPSETQATARPASPSASHEPISSVFPQPAGAAINVQAHRRPALRRACNRGRDTTCVATGTANLPSQSSAPAAQSAAPALAAAPPPLLPPGI